MSNRRTALQKHSFGFGARPALVVVDVTHGFTDPSCPLGANADSVVAANCELISAFRRRNWPVIVTTVVYRSEDEARVFRRRLPALNLLTPESHWVQFDARLPLDGTELIIEKRHASAFHGTDLGEELRHRQVDTVIVTGLTTSGCVRATAVDALQEEFLVVIPEEAVGDRDPEAHRANLYDLSAKYADVITLNDCMQAIDQI